MVKKLSIGSLAVLLIAGLMYAFVYFIVIPKIAAALMPLKWRNISTGQKKESYHVYLGRSDTSDDFRKYKGDLWFVKKDNYNFYLTIHYNADTIANFVCIYYMFHNGLFGKTENLMIDSL
jgi:hypothetical protein